MFSWDHLYKGGKVVQCPSEAAVCSGRELHCSTSRDTHSVRLVEIVKLCFLGPHILKHSLGKVGVTKLNFKIV